MIRAVEPLVSRKKEKIYVFLGGPIQGAPGWHEQVPDLGSDVELVCPKRSSLIANLSNSGYREQLDWETLGLRISDIILFWIPKEVKSIPGRDYAQTTKIELIENLVRGKKIVLGIEQGVNTRRYLVEKYKEYRGGYKVCDTFEDTIKLLKEEVAKIRNNRGVFFTSDTHFGQERTLELSRRPFSSVEDMDLKMIENWNNVIGPNSTVFHLGDFGNYDTLKYLNGNVNLICGNYERSDINKGLITRESLVSKYGFKQVLDRATFDLEVNNKLVSLVLCHEPVTAKECLSKNKDLDYALFGHIHGRQFIKPFGLDVGVDVHNYEPFSIDDIKFFINALIKGYYDKEVFVQ